MRGGANVHEILRFAQNDIGCFDAAKRTLGCLSTVSSAGMTGGKSIDFLGKAARLLLSFALCVSIACAEARKGAEWP